MPFLWIKAFFPFVQDSITAIPLDMWTLDFIAPNILCTTKGGVCIPTSYPVPKRAKKIEANGDDSSEQQPPKQDPETKLQYLKGPVRWPKCSDKCVMFVHDFIVCCFGASHLCDLS